MRCPTYQLKNPISSISAQAWCTLLLKVFSIQGTFKGSPLALHIDTKTNDPKGLYRNDLGNSSTSKTQVRWYFQDPSSRNLRSQTNERISRKWEFPDIEESEQILTYCDPNSPLWPHKPLGKERPRKEACRNELGNASDLLQRHKSKFSRPKS